MKRREHICLETMHAQILIVLRGEALMKKMNTNNIVDIVF